MWKKQAFLKKRMILEIKKNETVKDCPYKGKIILKVVPFPSSDSTDILPLK